MVGMQPVTRGTVAGRDSGGRVAGWRPRSRAAHQQDLQVDAELGHILGAVFWAEAAAGERVHANGWRRERRGEGKGGGGVSSGMRPRFLVCCSVADLYSWNSCVWRNARACTVRQYSTRTLTPEDVMTIIADWGRGGEKFG